MTALSPLELAHRAARRQAERLGHDDVVAYHYRLAADELLRTLRGQTPTDTTARIAAVAEAAEREASRRVREAPGYGTAG
jgi:hypothetical protein